MKKYIRFESAKAPLPVIDPKLTLEQLSSAAQQKKINPSERPLTRYLNMLKNYKNMDRRTAKIALIILWAFGPILLFGLGFLLLNLILGEKAYSGNNYWFFVIVLLAIFAIPNLFLFKVIRGEVQHRPKLDQYGRRTHIISKHRLIFILVALGSVVVISELSYWLSNDYRHYRTVNSLNSVVFDYGHAKQQDIYEDLNLPKDFNSYGHKLPKGYQYYIYSTRSYMICTNFRSDYKDAKTKGKPLNEAVLQGLSDSALLKENTHYLSMGSPYYRKGSNCFFATL